MHVPDEQEARNYLLSPAREILSGSAGVAILRTFTPRPRNRFVAQRSSPIPTRQRLIECKSAQPQVRWDRVPKVFVEMISDQTEERRLFHLEPVSPPPAVGGPLVPSHPLQTPPWRLSIARERQPASRRRRASADVLSDN
jgi:hypothetical protein